MPTPQYRALDHNGNPRAAAFGAPEHDLRPLRRDARHAPPTDHHDESADSPPSFLQKRISPNDLVYVTNQLAVMVETGVSLSEALAGIAMQSDHPTLVRVLRDLRDRVEGGGDLSSALAQYPRLFGKTYVNLVRAGEASGSLGTMLDRVARHQRKELETRSRIRAAMAYPLVMVVLAIGVCIFLLAHVFPKFTPLFASRSMQLPAPTRIMIAVSGAITGYWPLFLGALVLLAAGLLVFRRTRTGRRAIDSLKLNSPIVGPLFRKVALSRSLRTFSTMINSGVPMLDAIRLAGDVSSNVRFEDAWAAVADRVTGGQQIYEALDANPLFPVTVVQMIAAGEQTGKLGTILARVSDYFDEEVETTLKATMSLIEPLLMVVMGAVVGSIALALLLPIFSLSRPAA